MILSEASQFVYAFISRLEIYSKHESIILNLDLILHICHGHHGRCPWRKNLPCGEISPHDILSLGEILHMTDWHVEKVLHIRNVKKICYVEKQIVIWRNISTWEIWSKICCVEKISPHDKCRFKSVLWSSPAYLSSPELDPSSPYLPNK